MKTERGNDPPRHCMVVHAYYPVGETRVEREAAALVDRGFEVDVICLREADNASRGRHAGVDMYRLPMGRHRGRGLGVQLLEYCAFFLAAAAVVTLRHLRRPYRSVQVHNLPDFLVFCALVPKLTGARVLLDLHDLMPEFFAGRARVPMSHPLVRVLLLQERLACRFADHVITVTDVWRDTLVERGVPPEKVTVVMNVANAATFHRAPPPPVAAPSEAGFTVLYHGTFTHRYGVDLMLEAVAQARRDVPGLRVRLLGAGDLYGALLEQRRRLALEDCVEISDRMIEGPQLPAAIRECDVGVVPNRSDLFTDGLLPTKLLELVAVGRPVIAARTPTIAAYFDDDMVEFFTPGDAVELAAAMRRLAADPERRRSLVENADAFNRKYDWESTAAAYATCVRLPGPTAVAQPDGTGTRRAGTRRAGTLAHRPGGSGSPWRLRLSMSAEDPQWDRFLAMTPGGHHTQASLWGQVKASMGWQVARVIAEEDGEVVAGAQILYRTPLPHLRMGYVARGPVMPHADPGLASFLLEGIERTCRRLSIRHLTVQPAGASEEPPGFLRGRDYLDTTTEVAPRATVLLDVSRDPDELLAAMSPKTRYNIRLSGRKGVRVREGGADDLDTYHRLLRQTATRQGFAPFPRSYFEHMWEVLTPGGHIRLTFAECDGEVLAGQLAIVFGDTVVNKLSVWSGRGGNRRPNEALQWSTIRWAHDHGYRTYDLEGLKLSAARAIIAGERLPDSAEQSVSSYKLGFGGAVVIMPPARVYVTNPALRLGFRQVFPRISGRRAVKAVLKGMRTQTAPQQRKA